MPRSMTAFARLESTEGPFPLSLEIRSVNSRYCEVVIRAPRSFAPIEDRIRRLVQERLIRGRVELSIQMGGEQRAGVSFEPDVTLAGAYLDAATTLGRTLGLPGSLDLPTLLELARDVIAVREEKEDIARHWPFIKERLNELFSIAVGMAETEGERLAGDLRARMDQIDRWLSDISAQSADRVEDARNAIRERIAGALGEITLDEGRIAQEAAILADRLDITEENVRAASHVKQFRSVLAGDGPVGRKLDFLLQELFREVNTMASKSADVSISHLAVEIKAEMEKLREQVQNLV